MCLNGFDVISQLLGYLWAIVWLWYGLTHYRPSQNWFFWITTDIFGACFCVLALISLKLSNIKIATMLMVAIFFYDIFFVFITPLFLDGESIMLTVARGGAEGTSTADDFCYKYPDDKQCTGVDFLPMLIIIPRINDYSGGSVLLGLGDIICKYTSYTYLFAMIMRHCRF
jgi:signal peptide peptidase-like protein 2B